METFTIARLDWALCNLDYNTLFAKAIVTHLPKMHFYHTLLFVSIIKSLQEIIRDDFDTKPYRWNTRTIRVSFRTLGNPNYRYRRIPSLLKKY